MEVGVEEAEAAEAQAAAEEEALGVLEAEDLGAEAVDLAPWGIDRTWTALEEDQHLTAGYEKVRGMGRKRKTFGRPENAWVAPFYSPVGLLANHLAS